MINEKFIHEKTVYEFDLDSFERHQAYKISVPTIGIEDTEFIGILVYADMSTLKFFVTRDFHNKYVELCDENYGLLTISINDYMTNSISIVKLGVIDND